MATEREIVSPAAAVKLAASGAVPPAPDAPDAVERQAHQSQSPESLAALAKPTSWKFVKNFTPADVFTFKDGTSFSFPLIPRNDGSGFSPNSVATITDEALANNLRELTKNRATGVVELTQ